MFQKLFRPVVRVVSLLVAIHAGAAPHKVRVEDREVAQRLVTQGGRLIADYGAFHLIETDSAPQPSAALARAQSADEMDSIELNVRRLNTRAPEIQSLRRPAGAFAGRRLHLIHFAGPIKPEWLDALTQTGL